MTINNDANRNLAEAWIKLQYLLRKSDARDELWWAWEQLDELCWTEPERAWDVIQEIIAQDQSDQILADVGAGPIEDLLVHHGARIIDRVELCARSNSAFTRMLGVVWKKSIPDEVWKRVKEIAPPSW